MLLVSQGLLVITQVIIGEGHRPERSPVTIGWPVPSVSWQPGWPGLCSETPSVCHTHAHTHARSMHARRRDCVELSWPLISLTHDGVPPHLLVGRPDPGSILRAAGSGVGALTVSLQEWGLSLGPGVITRMDGQTDGAQPESPRFALRLWGVLFCCCFSPGSL